MDAQLIIQVITNLVDNAIKYTPDGSRITIKSYKDNGNAVAEVSDNGPGIPDESKDRIFQMFLYHGPQIADGKTRHGP